MCVFGVGEICGEMLLIISWLTILNLRGFICFPRFTNNYMMCQKDLLFKIVVIILLPNQKVKSYSTNNSHFLNKVKRLEKLLERGNLCSIDVVGLYPNITHSEVLTSFRRFLESRDNKQTSNDTLVELAEVVLKMAFLNLEKKLLNSYVELQSEQNLHLHMLLCLWLT